MSIVSYSEDILPEIPYATDLAATPAPEARLDIIRDISGCVALIGPVQVCYSLNVSIPSAAISLKVGPVTVISAEISPEHPCVTLNGSYGVAKWDLNICLRIPQKRITLEGKACVKILGCKSFNITLVHWGAIDFEEYPNIVGAPFPVTFYNASLAIDECYNFFQQGHPNLPWNQPGPVQVFPWGNGRWVDISSYYFNCGCNQHQNVAPPVGDIGQLSQHDGNSLEAWFYNRYSNYNPNVLKNGNKWNFTLVQNGAALNFHVSVGY